MELVGEEEKVRRYFDGRAERFDAIYRREKDLAQRVVDRLFHQVVHRRFHLAVELCGQVAEKRVLDAGCGSGRYCVEFARRGAQVTGVDFAPHMVEMARQAADRAGVAGQCRLVAADFLSWSDPDHFDICLGIGFFDYIANPGPFLEKLRHLTREQAVFSFPIRWTARSLTRWIRLNLNRCPVHFYTESQVRGLLGEAGWGGIALYRLSRDYLVHARPA